MVSRRCWISMAMAFILLIPYTINRHVQPKAAVGCAASQAENESGALPTQTFKDDGFPIYPNATQDPKNPPISTPFMTNIHLLTSDPFDTVVEWYTQKLGSFQVDRQERGSQALWNKKMGGGYVMTATITNILAPPGNVVIVLTKGKFGK